MAIVPDIQFPVFQQAMRVISSITNGFPAIVTTTLNHQYQTGMIVRLLVPDGFGMVQANKLYGSITVTGDMTFAIDIDTRSFDAFVVPSTFPQNKQFSQAVPMAENNNMLTAATRNVLPYAAV